MGKRSTWALPYFIFLLIFVALPLILIAVYAFQDDNGNFTLQQFLKFAHESETINTLTYSIQTALVTTVLCLLLGYPAAYILAQNTRRAGGRGFAKVTVMLFILPMWVNMLVRTLATVALFDFLNAPLGEGALIFGMVYNFLPFMIFPIYNVLEKMDNSYVEAAEDLGATPMQVLRKVIVPLSMPGVSSGIMMVFMPTISTFAIAELLTMNKVKLFGTTLQECINNGMWNYGACLALIMLILIGVTMLYSDDSQAETNETGGLI